MERHIALMGPPGVGKSTIIRAMADRSMRVLDFEALWHLPRPSNLRILNEMGSSSSRFIIGAAGFVPLEILQASFEPWLLYLPPTSYVGRRKRRDQRDPDKAGQKEYDISQWLMDWDSNFVLDARTPVSELVSDLRRYYRGEIVTPNSKFTKSALSNLGFPDVSQAGF